MNAITRPLLESADFNNLVTHLPALATGVADSQKSHLIYSVLEKSDKPGVIITYSELKAKEIFDDLHFFIKDNLYLYPSKDVIFYSADVHSLDIVTERFKVIDACLEGKRPFVVLSIEALLDRLMPLDLFKEFVIQMEVGDTIKTDSLLKKLVYMGYERTDSVSAAGQFSSRGGIIDIFPITAELPYRIEFWDNEVDSIRLVDPATQRSVEKANSARILPMREIVYDDEILEQAVLKIKNEYDETLKKCEKDISAEVAEAMRSSVFADIESLTQKQTVSQILKYVSFFYGNTKTLLDYYEEDIFVFYDEPLKIRQHFENVMYEFTESIEGHIENGYMLPSCRNIIFTFSDILQSSIRFSQILLMNFTQQIDFIPIKKIVHFNVKTATPFKGRVDLMLEELLYLKKNGYSIIILSGSRSRAERLSREFRDNGLETSYYDTLNDVSTEPAQVVVTRGSLNTGFVYSDLKFAVISDKEIFGEERKKNKRRPKKNHGTKIESFTELKTGDYVVHESHGIGIYKGIEKISINNISRDYLKISYADGGGLYVSVEQMDLVQKYIGGEAKLPKINKLGGNDWKKAKARVKKAVADLADELILLYAKRQESVGFSYSPDNIWQTEFEEMFPYEETQDQLVAIEDVKRDMESNKVMDRLVCGDVGYGKTEVAIRAAFKAVQDSKQVAYLVPTTILAQQHYQTFVQRMANFPVVVEMLSRFRTPKQQKLAIENLEKGKVDIVIGTHRLISNDVVFRDLGLVIIDEEQRFGVAHKEKLKKLRENVDILTLTATPIPRTLHMGLTGLRDLSLLEEPPQERQPIQTYVMEYNPEFVKDAVHRELARNGQVYYLHNRVMNIVETARRLEKLLPEARIRYAHGQMSERELEHIMIEFIEGNIDVLLCTTIIETGLDIPNVNTIIIQDADRMGLSQLYQLRGRVGRSNRIAYAYLLYKKDKVLQDSAEKRLQAIRESRRI